MNRVSLSILPLQSEIIYGLVPSKRLGVSLGINILPTLQWIASQVRWRAGMPAEVF